MFNELKQNCFDVKATASRMIRLTVHFEQESLSKVNSKVTADEVVAH